MSDLYTKYANEYSSVIKDNFYNASYDRPTLLSLVQDQKFDKCLDMGCGPGAYINPLSTFCKEIVAVDGSKEFIDIVKTEYPNVKSYVQDLNDGIKKEEDGVFDLVIAPLMIHYIADLSLLFSEVSRVLKKGGTFVFSTVHPIVNFTDFEYENYFVSEKVTQKWDTLKDKIVEVSFYKRPISTVLQDLFDTGLYMNGISEGIISEEMRLKSKEEFEKMLKSPQFLFVRAVKVS